MIRPRSAWPAILAVAVLGSLALVGCGRDHPSANGPTASPTTTTPSTTPTPPPTTATPPPTTTTPPPTTATRPPTTPPPTTARPFPSSLLGQDLTRIPTNSKVVALTFDAGANADGVASILATLQREHVPATFFLTGSFAQNFPSQARSIAAGGFRIGNHSQTHPYFTQLSDSQIRSQLSQAASAIRTATGVNPAPLFRFPYGDRNSRTIATVNAAGYLPIRWTVDSLGWQGTEKGGDAADVTQRVLAARTNGEIVLMHVGSNPNDHTTFDADALPSIIAGLRGYGYTFVSLNVLLS